MRYSLPENGFVFLVDKPYGWTSFQVVNKVRWILKRLTGIKKIKVGHAGTLDPLATGLLVLCVGRQTKNIAQYSGDDKTYLASIRMGYESASYDLEKKVIIREANPVFSDEKIEQLKSYFSGVIDQIPPGFSAKKVGGKRAYLSARAGEEVQLASNEVEIKKLEIDTQRWPVLEMDIVCSKGTYIRSLANDFGNAYGSGAILAALRRTQSGNYLLADAVKMSVIWEELKLRLEAISD
ncbi:MAG: tRNA pseudouridine(55) synthase TruB [Luteibaculum sp.]